MKAHEAYGKIGEGFQVYGEASGKLLFTIPETERGTCESDRVSVGDRIKLSYGEGYISFEKVRS